MYSSDIMGSLPVNSGSNRILEITGVHIFPFLAVALIWGSTDVLIAKASIQSKDQFKPNDFSPISLIRFILSKRIWVWMGINQVGSVLYSYLLGIYPQQYSLIWANSLTVLVSFVLDKCLWYYQFQKDKNVSISSKQSDNSEVKNNQVKNLKQRSFDKKKQIENFFGIVFIILGIYLMLV